MSNEQDVAGAISSLLRTRRRRRRGGATATAAPNRNGPAAGSIDLGCRASLQRSELSVAGAAACRIGSSLPRWLRIPTAESGAPLQMEDEGLMPPMILGGLSGSVARSLPDLGMLRGGPSGRAFEEPSVTALVNAFDADRRDMVAGVHGRRPRTSPNVTVLPLTAAQRHDSVVDPIHGPRPRRMQKKKITRRPDIDYRDADRRKQRRKETRDSRWTQPSALAKNRGPQFGLPAAMMQRHTDITAADPTVELVERRTSDGWRDGQRDYGALADYERGFGQGSRATIGLMHGAGDRWDSSLKRTADLIESPFRPSETYGSSTGKPSTKDLHHFYCAVTEKEVQLQVRPSHYAEELLAALNPALRGDIHAAANTMQAAWRGYVARRDVADMYSAALRVKNDKTRRIAEEAKAELRRHMAAKIVQARIRGNQTRMGQLLRDVIQAEEDKDGEDMTKYAWAIQKSFRSWMFRFRLGIHIRRKRRSRIRRRWRMPIEGIKQARKASDARGRISATEQEEMVKVMEEAEEEVVAEVANMQMMQLRVRVIECADLVNKDLMGGNDVFVTVSVMSQSRRTLTRENAGTEAAWGSGDGEELVYNIHGSEIMHDEDGKLELQIDVYDEDIGSSDDLIGSYKLITDDLSRADNLVWDSPAEWYDLHDNTYEDPYAEDGAHAYLEGNQNATMGRVRLAIDWGPPAPECRGLLRLSRLDKNDVKVKLIADGEDYDVQEAFTSTIEDGGTDCQWSHGRGETILLSSKAPPAMLTIEVMDEDGSSQDDSIGTALRIALLNQETPEAGEWSLDARWYDLTAAGSTKKGTKSAGRVRMSVAWEDQTGQAEYDAMDLITHFDTRAEMALATRGKVGGAESLSAAPQHVLRQRKSASAEGEMQLSGEVTDAMGGAHIRMFSTERNQTWRDNSDHSHMLTVGFLQSVNITPDPDLRCDMVLSMRDRTKEPLQEVRETNRKRCLLVTVLECRKLKKADIFGKNDVFATLSVDGVSQQTATVDDGGTAPKWNGGAGESFLFQDLEGLPSAMAVGIWDEDVGSASDLIGDMNVDLTDAGIAEEEDWSEAQWYDLNDDKGKQVGEVHMLMRWGHPPPALDAPKLWQVRVKVLECASLKKMDLLGKNDVYVKVHVGGSAGPQRTVTIDGGGAEPKWGSGAGEVMTFELSEPPPSVGIEVFDEDRDADDLIGGNVFELGTKVGDRKEWSAERWLELTDARNKVTGKARVAIFWERKPPARFKLACGVVECKGLIKADRFGKNDVYVSLSAGNGQTRRTTTIDGGGEAPVWANGDGETVEWDVPTAPESLLVEVWDEDVGSKDDLLGRLTLPLGRVLADVGHAQAGAWQTLVDAKGQSAGMVKLSLNWHPLPSDDPPQQAFTVQPSVLPSSTSKDINQRIKWGSSQVFKVDDSTYQKLEGSFYLVSRPDRKLGEFVAGLRSAEGCRESYQDMWITVRPPAPTISLNCKWQVIPSGADINQPVGIATLALTELLSLHAAPQTAGKSGLYLKSIIKSAGTRQAPSWGEVPLPEIAKDLSIIPIGKTVVVRRLGRISELRIEIMQKASDGGTDKDTCLLTFVVDLSAALFVENESTDVTATIERDESDMMRAEAYRHFEDVDEDGSGFLERDEIKRLAHAVGQELGEHELDEAMKEMDADGSGEVDFEEYYAWWQAMKAAQTKAEEEGGGGGAGGMLTRLFARQKKETRSKGRSLVSKAMRTEKDSATARQAFDAVDADNSGWLDAAEIRQLAVTLGKKMEDDELELAMTEMRGNATEIDAARAAVAAAPAESAAAAAATAELEAMMSAGITFDQFNEWWQKRGQGQSAGLRGIRGALGNNLLDGIMHARKNKKQEQAIAQHTQVRQAFDVIDVDGSGTLDSVELRALMATLYPGKKHTQLELLAAMREMRQEEGADYDAITFDNFFMWWTAQKDKQGGKIKALKGLFGRSSATVAAAESSEYANLKEMTPAEIEEHREAAVAAFQTIDRDGDGTLDIGEVRLLLLDLGRPDSELDAAALSLAMAEMRGGGGGKTPVNMDQFVQWWLQHKADNNFDGGAAGGEEGGSGLTGLFKGFGKKKKKKNPNKVYPEPAPEPAPKMEP